MASRPNSAYLHHAYFSGSAMQAEKGAGTRSDDRKCEFSSVGQTALWFQKAENSDTRLRPHIHMSVSYHRRNKFIAVSELITISRGLIGVIQFLRKIAGIVGVQHPKNTRQALKRPNNAILRAIR